MSQGRQHGVCVNGCSFTRIAFTAGALSVDIVTPFRWPNSFTLVVGQLCVSTFVCSNLCCRIGCQPVHHSKQQAHRHLLTSSAAGWNLLCDLTLKKCSVRFGSCFRTNGVATLSFASNFALPIAWDQITSTFTFQSKNISSASDKLGLTLG